MNRFLIPAGNANDRFYTGTVLAVLFGLLSASGCETLPKPTTVAYRESDTERAMQVLKSSVHFSDNAVVRAAAVEALEAAGPEALPWIRTALSDDHPGVRFAACLAVGSLRDEGTEDAIRRMVTDPDTSVQVAALYALHRLGDEQRTGRIPTYLLENVDLTVRRNAALVLGRLGEPAAVKILARAMRDRDPGVRNHVLEAMARLGNKEARQELILMTNSGAGTDEAFAVSALAELGDLALMETFRFKFRGAAHAETRLAAARGLGRLGSDEGYSASISSLKSARPEGPDDLRDPPAERLLRVRMLAAAALGAIGRLESLSTLDGFLGENVDPRLKVAAARAVVEITQGTIRQAHTAGVAGVQGRRSE